jgi:MFS family permease
MRGRVMALYMMIFQGGTPLGAPIVGWVGGTFGARWTLIGGGGLTILGVLAAVLLFTGAEHPTFPFGRRAEPDADETADRVLAA